MDLAITPTGALPSTAPADQRLKQAAAQFEGYFLGEILKFAEPEPGEEGLMDGDGASTTYRQLYHGALAEQAAGSLGIADLLMQELSTRTQIDKNLVKGTP
jgi:Rod binding domain-containing protein